MTNGAAGQQRAEGQFARDRRTQDSRKPQRTRCLLDRLFGAAQQPPDVQPPCCRRGARSRPRLEAPVLHAADNTQHRAADNDRLLLPLPRGADADGWDVGWGQRNGTRGVLVGPNLMMGVSLEAAVRCRVSESTAPMASTRTRMAGVLHAGKSSSAIWETSSPSPEGGKESWGLGALALTCGPAP